MDAVDGPRRWRVTDIGTRTVVVIRVDQVTATRLSGGVETTRVIPGADAEADGWFRGPPYGVAETVFDEDDIRLCRPADEEHRP